jgi:hypothetical protein
VANGYDEHSMKMQGAAKEAVSSSDNPPMTAVRDKRFTRSGIGWRSQAKAQEASTLDPGQIGQTPPPIMFPDGFPGGVATRKRGQVDEAALPWQTAQEATSPQVKPRETLPPWGNGMNEALPPWLQKDDKEEQKEALPPWLQGKNKDDEEKEASVKQQPDMNEAADADDIGGFPDEEDAREALEVVAQFADGDVVKSVQDAIVKQYGDPKFSPATAGGDEDDYGDDDGMGLGPMVGMGEGKMPVTPDNMDEATEDKKAKVPPNSLTLVDEAELDAKKRNALDDSDFALPGRKYPIPDESHARSALQRVKQFGSPGDQAKVKAAVKRKFPDMDVKD